MLSYKTKKVKYSVISIFVLAVVSTQHGFSDVDGASDHPLIKRITGSEIFFSKRADFDQLKLALGKIKWNGGEMRVDPFEHVVVEGKVLTNYYLVPEGLGTLEVLRNYEQELREQGFEILFSGRGEELETPGYNNEVAREVFGMKGSYATPEEKAQWPFQQARENTAAYLAARKKTETGEIFVSVYVVNNTLADWLKILPLDRTLVRLDVCEVQPREQRMELVTREQMAGEISLNGRIALYGILFDFNSATLRSESEPTLAEAAALLEANPDLRILVVGHTDTVGSFSFNKDLSQKRAESVVADLIRRGIKSDRLFPVGVSFASPVATNATEDGRAKNRRVELVDLAGGRLH